MKTKIAGLIGISMMLLLVSNAYALNFTGGALNCQVFATGPNQFGEVASLHGYMQFNYTNSTQSWMVFSTYNTTKQFQVLVSPFYETNITISTINGTNPVSIPACGAYSMNIHVTTTDPYNQTGYVAAYLESFGNVKIATIKQLHITGTLALPSTVTTTSATTTIVPSITVINSTNKTIVPASIGATKGSGDVLGISLIAVATVIIGLIALTFDRNNNRKKRSVTIGDLTEGRY